MLHTIVTFCHHIQGMQFIKNHQTRTFRTCSPSAATYIYDKLYQHLRLGAGLGLGLDNGEYCNPRLGGIFIGKKVRKIGKEQVLDAMAAVAKWALDGTQGISIVGSNLTCDRR